MDTQPRNHYRYRMLNRTIGNIEVMGAVLLLLTGYSIGKDSVIGIVIAAAYAICKNIVERAKPIDPIADDETGNATTKPELTES